MAAVQFEAYECEEHSNNKTYWLRMALHVQVTARESSPSIVNRGKEAPFLHPGL